jgi:hypothetical protein
MIRELDAINALSAHLADARLSLKEAKTPEGRAGAQIAVCSLVFLARTLSKSSDMPAEFLRRVGVKP